MPTSQPNYLFINPDGTVGAQFAGGVEIVSDSSNTYDYGNPKTQKSVSWHQDTVSGALVAAISVHSPAPAVVGSTGIDITAITPDGLSRASLNPTVQGGAGALAQVLALATTTGPPGETRRTIVDERGQSSFLQLPGAAKQYAIDFSLGAAVTLAFGGAASASTVVNHALNRNPQVILAMLFGGPAPAQITLTASGLTNAQFTLNAVSSVALAGSLFAWWAAIG